jgi:hypothetical protein
MQGLRHADFVIEAVVEDEAVKRSIFQQLDKVTGRGLCITPVHPMTPASCLSPSFLLADVSYQINEACQTMLWPL